MERIEFDGNLRRVRNKAMGNALWAFEIDTYYLNVEALDICQLNWSLAMVLNFMTF